MGADGRDTLNDNGEWPLFVSANHGLALWDMFFSTAKIATSYIRSIGEAKHIFDFIFTRQRDKTLMQDVTVHPQPPFLPISDHNIVTTHLFM